MVVKHSGIHAYQFYLHQDASTLASLLTDHNPLIPQVLYLAEPLEAFFKRNLA